MLLKNKKKVNAKAAQNEVERELSEDSLGQVAGGKYIITGNPDFDRRQRESFRNQPHIRMAEYARKQDEAGARFVSDFLANER